jgi:hypothetical protein
MAHQKEGQTRAGFFNGPVNPAYIVLYRGYPVYVIAVPQKPALSRLVHRKIGGLPVAPLIGGPYLDAFAAKPPGKSIVTERMFRHTVYNMKNGPNPALFSPAPQEKLGPAPGFKPLLRGFDLPRAFRYI